MQLKTESYLITQKLPSEEIPSGSLSHFLCFEAPTELSFIKSPEKNSKREPHTTISKLKCFKNSPKVLVSAQWAKPTPTLSFPRPYTLNPVDLYENFPSCSIQKLRENKLLDCELLANLKVAIS